MQIRVNGTNYPSPRWVYIPLRMMGGYLVSTSNADPSIQTEHDKTRTSRTTINLSVSPSWFTKKHAFEPDSTPGFE
jgi:hypothetical protein